jgi:RNA polymerase sigma-70 factor (ECF subfamily)
MYSFCREPRFVLSKNATIMNANLKTASDTELIDLFKQGDHQVFGELYERYYKTVYSRCRQVCKDDEVAFDLSQEVMLKAFDHLNEFRGNSLFKTWIYTIASRHCFSYLHKVKPGQALTENLSDMLADENEEDQQTLMLSLIQKLPVDEKQLLLRKYENGTSVEDLEKEMNLSASAIKMRLKRSREKLNFVYSLALTFGLDYALNMLETL